MMAPRDVALAVLVAVIWGVGFVFSKLALETLSALQLVVLRFAIGASAVLVLKRPPVPIGKLVTIGLTLFAGQFLFQFLGIANGMPPALASLVVQTQALFTVLFAALLLAERPTPREVAGVTFAALGLLVISATIGEDLTRQVSF